MKLLLLLLCSTFAGRSQAQEDRAVQKTIQTLFDGMRKGDSAMVRSVFYKDAILQTAMVSKKGDTLLRKESVAEFIKAIGTPHDKVWDEIIWSYDIKVDGLMAMAWTPYTFYLGETLSHCGVNAFLLFHNKKGWEIVSIMDTRKKENCKSK